MVLAPDIHVIRNENRMMKVIQLRWRCVLFIAAIAAIVFLLYYTVRKPKYGYNCQGPYWQERTLQHLNRYCNPLNVPVSGKEGSVPGDQYKLISAHMLIRHGDRYNMHSLPNYENKEVSCQIDEDLKDQVPNLRSYVKKMEELSAQGGRAPSQTFHAYNLYPNKDTCGLAHLTPTGAAQHLRNGEFLKKVYIENSKLIEQEKLYEQVMVRSTTKSRTFQSALALMFGFLPQFDLQKLNIEDALNNTMCTEKSGLPCGCLQSEPLIDTFSCNFQQRSPHVMAQPQIREAYAQMADVFGVASNSLPPPSHIFDVNMVHFCHQLRLPYRSGQCVQPWVFKNIYDEVNENGRNQVKALNLQRIVRLKLQPLLYEISRRMEAQLAGKSPLKFVLYSGHDSTIEPFANAMGFSQGVWSRYASRITLELYSSQDQGFIRVLHDGNQVTESVSFCADHLTDVKLGLCPLTRFIQYVDHGNIEGLNEEDYAKACKKDIPY